MLASATVTLSYKEFEEIKDKADLYEEIKKEKEKIEEEKYTSKECKTIDGIEALIVKAANHKETEYKQWFLVLALKELCSYYGCDFCNEYPDINEGTKP